MKKLNLESQAKSLKRRAGALIRQTKLLSLLKQYGQVEITGSYSLNLMTNPDIDIHVVNKKITRRLVLKALIKLIKSERFRGHLFYDFTIHQHSGFPRGWYVGLKKRYHGEKWKIDIWFIKKERELQSNLPTAGLKQRQKVLRLKTVRDRKNIDLPSWYIYLAVLKNNVEAKKKLALLGLKV